KMVRTASALPHREEGLRRRCAGGVRARAWAWPASVVALAVGACLLRWPYLDVPISADEGGYATAAYWWARGDALYRGLTITRPGAARGRWLVAGYGALAAVALLIKPSGVAALALAALWLLLRRRGEGAGWAAWLRAEATLGLGFAAGLVPALVHGLLTAPGVYLDAVLLYRLRADSLVAGAAGYQA